MMAVEFFNKLRNLFIDIIAFQIRFRVGPNPRKPLMHKPLQGPTWIITGPSAPIANAPHSCEHVCQCSR